MKTLPISMRVLLLALSMLVGVAGLSGSQARASTLTVNTTADNTTCDSFLSLREAILMGQGSFTRALTAGEAAQISGAVSTQGPPSPGCPGPFGFTFGTVGTQFFDSINFGNSVTTISPSSQLPRVLNSDSVNGLKPDNSKVILSGSSAGAAFGLIFSSSGTANFGGGADNLIINNFSNAGIVIEGTWVHVNNSVIRNNGGAGILLVGVDIANGNVANPRGDIANNFIHSNVGNGILVSGFIGNNESSCGGDIVGNYIGYRDTTLMTDDGNGSDGIKIANCTYLNIGITSNGADGRNYIGGNNADGIQLTGAKTFGHRIVNNIIGKSSNFAGGGFGNNFSGIAILNGAGLMPVSLFAPNQIGEPNKPNVISGNAQSGVFLSDPNSSAIISNNYIGTNSGANDDIGNGNPGVTVVNSASASVGGDTQGSGNVIAFNSVGVWLTGTSSTSNIRRNRIFGNDALGIDLNGDGVTPNDLGDGDTGPNGLQNYPVLTGVSGGGASTTVTGSFNSNPNRNYIVAFFGNTSCNASGYGEGRTFLGEVSAATNVSGNVTLNAVLPIGISSAGSFVTATALDTSTAQTSEFSQCQPVICNYSLSASSANVGSSAGSGSFQITTTVGCDWTPASNAGWIMVAGGGNGNGTVGYNFTQNTGPQRSGTITLGGQTHTVTQSAATATGSSPFDFDGDRKTDVSIYRPSLGQWWHSRSSDGGNRALTFGVSTDRIAPADFTGDGKTDIAFFRPSNGFWFVLRSEDNSFFATPFGANGDVPKPTDFDADGKADIAVFRPSNSTWYINYSGGAPATSQQFGIAGDLPVAADYDGDAKADIAIYRPNAAGGGQWWIQRSSTNVVAALQFGTSTDKTVVGDYTGDGKADIAFWRPSTGFWNILRSEDLSYFAFPFGTTGDVPVPGDYDGDGKFDAGVFRPSNSTWYVQRSTAGTLIQQFGITGDLPLPNAYVR